VPGVELGEPILDPREEIGETYLHLEAVDLADEQAVVKFAHRHGVLGVRFQDYEALGPWLRRDQDARKRLKLSVRRARRDEEKWSGAKTSRSWATWGEGLSRERATLAPSRESLEEFRFGAGCVKDLISAWRVLCGERGHHWQIEKLDRPQAAANRLDAALRTALQIFSPTAAFLQDVKVLDDKAAADAVAARHWTQAPLYNCCLLELFNHIVEGAEYRLCKECGRRFVRQEGRARFRQHRTRGKGASLYCSVAHASANTTRASRLRKEQR
jgi:hypothetical protein